MKLYQKILSLSLAYLILSANGNCDGGDDTAEVVDPVYGSTSMVLQPGDVLKGYERGGFKIKCMGPVFFQDDVSRALDRVNNTRTGRKLFRELAVSGASEEIMIFLGDATRYYAGRNINSRGGNRIEVGATYRMQSRGLQLDAALLHEMIHVLHDFTGELRERTMHSVIPQIDWGITEEEYLTTGIPFDVNYDGKVYPRRLIDGEGLDGLNHNAYLQEIGAQLRSSYRTATM